MAEESILKEDGTSVILTEEGYSILLESDEGVGSDPILPSLTSGLIIPIFWWAF